MRDCQPGPSSRKAATTSGSRRIVVETFVAADGLRPRRTFATANFTCHSGALRSGASSSKSRTVERVFAVIGLPQRNDSAHVAASGPNSDDHARVEKTDRDETILAVVAASSGAVSVAPAKISPARAISRPRSCSVRSRLAASNSISTEFLLLQKCVKVQQLTPAHNGHFAPGPHTPFSRSREKGLIPLGNPPAALPRAAAPRAEPPPPAPPCA